MIKSSFIFQLADTLSKQMGKAPLASVTPVSMYPDEQGYSGAKLVRLNCTFSDGKTGSFVCKYAVLPERMVMQTLTDQKQAHSPFSYTDGNETKERAWFIMQDVRTSESIPQDTNLWKRKTAAALADIHTDNLMCADQLPHLPHADEEYWNHITTQISISHLEKRCAEDNAFAARYAGMLPKLHKCAERHPESRFSSKAPFKGTVSSSPGSRASDSLPHNRWFHSACIPGYAHRRARTAVPGIPRRKDRTAGAAEKMDRLESQNQCRRKELRFRPVPGMPRGRRPDIGQNIRRHRLQYCLQDHCSGLRREGC